MTRSNCPPGAGEMSNQKEEGIAQLQSHAGEENCGMEVTAEMSLVRCR